MRYKGRKTPRKYRHDPKSYNYHLPRQIEQMLKRWKQKRYTEDNENSI